MGYTTEFTGSFQVTPAVSDEFKNYINLFSETRRMKRDNEEIKKMDPNWKEHCFYGDLGEEGEYYTVPKMVPRKWNTHPWSFQKNDNDSNLNPDELVPNQFGQAHDPSILEYNYPPENQPGLWCQWYMPDNNTIEWDGAEKFYNYTEWIEYLIENFFAPKGYTVNGSVEWCGEEEGDEGVITIKNNEVTAHYYM